MKSFFIPVGQYAGASLTTVLSALSCGAALPVSGLDILHIADREADPVLPPLVMDLNSVHSLLSDEKNNSLFPSSFCYESFRPLLPSVRSLSEDAATAALLGALRGKGLPLSYKTDRDAVEWAFSSLLSDPSAEQADPIHAWIEKIRNCVSAGEPYRIAVCCDLSDPFSAGAAFAVLRFISETVKPDPACISLFCLCAGMDSPASFRSEMTSSSIRALAERNLISTPDKPMATSMRSPNSWVMVLI